MEWIDVKERLPKEKKPYLGYCYNEYGNDSWSWQGIVEVYFDPSIGWRRCEKYDDKSVKVLYWGEMPKMPNEK